ncbi:MAG: GntR family transcriptional regulator [Rhizobium sp.]|nr:GntR family transcriptional regulator [Rhizobium sp.]
MTELASFLSADDLQSAGQGPLYVKLQQALAGAIRSGRLRSGDALPPERDLAEYASISRVTVRKAVDELVRQGILVRRHGSGTFVATPVEKVEQPLSRLTSFTEDMARRGRTSRAEWLERGLFTPSPDEMMMLGLAAGGRVARLERLRIADENPLAIERASISAEFLPDPEKVGNSLYAALEARGVRPIRAVQRISARNIKDNEARLLNVAPGSAGLTIERISYLPSGKVVELTRSLYRGDAYDFVAELTLG